VIAISGSLLINGGCLTLMALRRSEPRPPLPPTVTVLLEREPVTAPSLPPPALSNARQTIAAPGGTPAAATPTASSAAPSPTPPVREAEAPATSRATQPGPDRPALKLGRPGCEGANAARPDRRQCWSAPAPGDRFAQTQQDRETYAALPPGAGEPDKAPPVPGWHYTPPFGLVYVYGPNDKHFLPGFGSSAKPVFKKEDLYNVPIPTNP